MSSFGHRQNILILNDLGYIDGFVKLALQSLGDEVLELFGREAGELLCQSVDDRGIVRLLPSEKESTMASAFETSS